MQESILDNAIIDFFLNIDVSMGPKISVIMPVFNAEKYLREAIQGVLGQSYSNIELIIADDGSTDNSRHLIDKIALEDKRIGISHNSKNLGKTATVNRLFTLCNGEFITIHDADDISHSQRFEKQLQAFEIDPELALCGTSFYTVDNVGFIMNETEMPSDYNEILKNIEVSSQFHGPTMMMRRSVLETLDHIYRPYFRDNYEDTDLAYRIVEKFKAINLKDSLYIYRILDTSLCRRDIDVRNRNLYKVVVYLAGQRKINGRDVLMENAPEKADDFLQEITQDYKHDRSLIYREAASYYFYWNLNRKAIQSACKGFIKEPLKIKNLRTLLYIFRKGILKLYHAKTAKKHYKEILFKNF